MRASIARYAPHEIDFEALVIDCRLQLIIKHSKRLVCELQHLDE